ncbi:MAG: cold-shock protein [Armatimonadota bacterium]
MATGTVKWFDQEKAYGFITDESGADVFVHVNDIEPGGPPTLSEGDKVQFEAVDDLRGPKATNVKVLSSVTRRDRSELGKPPPRRLR